MKNLQNYLFELCGEHLPSGFEQGAHVVKNLLSPLVDECYTDRSGNVVGVRKAVLPNAKKILLDAHLDEIGLIVTKIDDHGFLHFTNLAVHRQSLHYLIPLQPLAKVHFAVGNPLRKSPYPSLANSVA